MFALEMFFITPKYSWKTFIILQNLQLVCIYVAFGATYTELKPVLSLIICLYPLYGFNSKCYPAVY